MQNLFLSSNQDEIYENLSKYFYELDQFASTNNLQIDFIVTHLIGYILGAKKIIILY